MWDLRVCAACLATNVRMFSMSATSLLQPYQLLSGIQFQSGDGMPRKLCWECAALVHKLSLFKHKCERAYLLLQDIYNQHDEISEEDVERIDRKENNLSSNLLSENLNVFVPSTTYSKPVKRKTKKMLELHVPTEVKVEVPIEVDNIKLEDVKADIEAKTEEIETEDILHIGDSPEHLAEVNVEDDMDDLDLEVDPVAKEASVDQGFTVDTFPLKYTPRSVGHKPRNNLYICRMCSHTTRNQVTAHQHQQTHMTSVKKIRRIDVINATVTSLTQNEMKERFRERERSKLYTNAIYKCSICFLTYRTSAKLMSHLARHDESYGRFECDMCKFRFTTKATLRRHFDDHHNNMFACNLCPHVCCSIKQAHRHHECHNTTCAVCRLTFDSKPLLRKHSLTHSQFVCGECGRKCRSSNGLGAHMRKHHLPQKYKYSCEVCQMPLRNKQQMQLHYRTRHPDAVVSKPKTFICETCGRAYKSEALLRKHNLLHRGIKQYKCKICEKTFGQHSAWSNHMRSHSDVRANVCDVCGKSFKTSTVLRAHKTLHSATRDFKCDLCPKAYTNSKNLWMHKKMYHSVRPYTCDYCHRGYSFKSELEKHIKRKNVHEMGRPLTYRCSMCDLEFATHNESITHRQNTHNNDVRTVPVPNSDMVQVNGKKFEFFAVPKNDHEISRTYKCKVCMKSFSKYTYLYIHNKSHSEERPFICSVCNKGFKFKAGLKRHVVVHTGEKPYKCDMCEKGFTTNDWRQQHIRRAHLNEHIPYKPRVRGKRRVAREPQAAV